MVTTHRELNVQLVVLGDAELALLVPNALPSLRVVVLDHVRGLRWVVARVYRLVQHLQHKNTGIVIVGVDPLRHPRQEPARPVVVLGCVEAGVVDALGFGMVNVMKLAE